jgi:threonine/homoserine/homoserine lactone efflux protein
MIVYLVFGMTYGFGAAVQPGQFQAYLISQTLAHGLRRTIPAAFAPILSDAPIICLVLVVLTRVPPLFVSMLQVAGGLFLLYLGSRALAAFRGDKQAAVKQAAPAHQTVVKAAVVNLLNPNPYLAWALVLGPLLLTAWRQAPANAAALIVSFYLTMVSVTAAIVMVFAAARSRGRRVAHVLLGVSAVALAGFGVYQLWSGSTALIQRF